LEPPVLQDFAVVLGRAGTEEKENVCVELCVGVDVGDGVGVDVGVECVDVGCVDVDDCFVDVGVEVGEAFVLVVELGPDPEDSKMSFWAPSENPHLALYAGDLCEPSKSYPETSILFPLAWFHARICFAPLTHWELSPSHQTGGCAFATGAVPVAPVTVHRKGVW